MPWQLFAVYTLLMACLGVAMEIVFTALWECIKSPDWRLQGHTYIWMIPIYALVYPALCLIYPIFGPWALPLRGLVYTSLIYAVEYSSGFLLRALTGEAPWEKEYRSSPWAIHGLIRLDFAPAWFAASMIFEAVFRTLQSCSYHS